MCSALTGISPGMANDRSPSEEAPPRDRLRFFALARPCSRKRGLRAQGSARLISGREEWSSSMANDARRNGRGGTAHAHPHEPRPSMARLATAEPTAIPGERRTHENRCGESTHDSLQRLLPRGRTPLDRTPRHWLAVLNRRYGGSKSSFEVGALRGDRVDGCPHAAHRLRRRGLWLDERRAGRGASRLPGARLRS